MATSFEARSKDYSKTFSHNPQLIVAYENMKADENSAMEQASVIEERHRKNSLIRERNLEEERKRSQERGKKALTKVIREKEYEEYSR